MGLSEQASGKDNVLELKESIQNAVAELTELTGNQISEKKVTEILCSYFPEVNWAEKISATKKDKEKGIGRSITDGIIMLLKDQRYASLAGVIEAKISKPTTVSADAPIVSYGRSGTGIFERN